MQHYFQAIFEDQSRSTAMPPFRKSERTGAFSVEAFPEKALTHAVLYPYRASDFNSSENRNVSSIRRKARRALDNGWSGNR